MSINIFGLCAYKDNYIWMMVNKKNELIIVDPGDSLPVLEYLQNNPQLKLKGIFITHKHWDHCNGVPKILNHFPVPVYGPYTTEIDFITHPLREKDKVTIEGFPLFTVMEIPGHTLEHIAFYNEQTLFCGDTLFTGGCGRIFEGTPLQMFQTLKKIMSLPDEILIYCGHEYTLKNLAFAKCVEPHNPDLLLRTDSCEKLRNEQQPTVPSTLKLEKLTNPFLRCHIPEVVEAVKKHTQKNMNEIVDIFEHLRQWKDNF